MAAIDELIEQIDNPVLRERIAAEVQRMVKQKKFGLVFEEHLPEITLLYEVPVKRGSIVARNSNTKDLYQVLEIDSDRAVCLSKSSKEQKSIPLAELVSVAEFGEPIYPYLEPLDSVENAPDSGLWHTLIEADNYHALQLLDYMYHGKVDCIYIDPPYNTGAKDWKYNDAYVDKNDSYRHSKWISMMKKRLYIAKKILNKNGVLVISISYHELNSLVFLLEEIFPDKQVVTITVQTSGGKPSGGFNYLHEYIIYVASNDFSPKKTGFTGGKIRSPFEGLTLATFNQVQRPNQTYPIYVDEQTLTIKGCGLSLAEKVKSGIYSGALNDYEFDYNDAPNGCVSIWPVTSKGDKCVWRLISERLLTDWKKGYIKVSPNRLKKAKNKYSIQYLPDGVIKKIESGKLKVLGREKDKPTFIFDDNRTEGTDIPTIWSEKDFYTTKGTAQLDDIFAKRRFPYPKPLSLITEIIRSCTSESSLVLDFFAGSGTTLQAVNLLNAEDGGNRQCIMVTNNEVSDAETKSLKKQGHNPGDEEWNNLGIARYVTWPRTVCSIEGHDINGEPLKGNYLGTDRPMADGFAANANFFKLGFLDKNSVAYGTQLEKLLPVLWMKAGAYGKCPVGNVNGRYMIYAENKFAILVNTKYAYEFKQELPTYIDVAYIITDYEPEYHDIANSINVKTTYHLYRDYLDNFTINTGRI